MGQIIQKSIIYSGAGSTDYIDLTATLAVGETSLTVCNNVFNNDSVVDIFTDPYGVVPTSAVISTGLITLTFNARSQPVDILIRVYKERGSGGVTYKAGRLLEITNNHTINVLMEKSTEDDIAEQSAQNPNTLFFTEGANTEIFTTIKPLGVSDWGNDNTQTIDVLGITTDTNIIVTPVSDNTNNFDNYCNAGIRAYAQSTDHISFKCITKPSVTVNVAIAYWG